MSGLDDPSKWKTHCVKCGATIVDCLMDVECDMDEGWR